MKTAIRALLGTFRLAPAGHVNGLKANVLRAEMKLAELEGRLVQSRADAESWKRRYEEASDALAGWRQAATRTQAELDRVKTGADKAKADLGRAKDDAEREQARVVEWKELAHTSRSRLDEARSAAESSSEQLIAMEVKLDLIEAAIQVLDARTRQHAIPRGESEAHEDTDAPARGSR